MVALYLTYTPIEWVNEDGGSLMAFDITEPSQSERMVIDPSSHLGYPRLTQALSIGTWRR